MATDARVTQNPTRVVIDARTAPAEVRDTGYATRAVFQGETGIRDTGYATRAVIRAHDDPSQIRATGCMVRVMVRVTPIPGRGRWYAY